MSLCRSWQPDSFKMQPKINSRPSIRNACHCIMNVCTYGLETPFLGDDTEICGDDVPSEEFVRGLFGVLDFEVVGVIRIFGTEVSS